MDKNQSPTETRENPEESVILVAVMGERFSYDGMAVMGCGMSRGDDVWQC